ncbi:hypothetical protein PM082_013622 [Marasmius tenuissimus]|nr:hypothetical protein PM082_013622 [Marasmius tenuissimus]
MASSTLVVIFLSGWSQIIVYGFNTVLFCIGMYLLSKRKARDGIIFQAVSSTVVFALATASAVLCTSTTVAGLELSMPTAPPKIDERACGIVLLVVIHLIDFTAFMILVYRCFNIWSRSWKVIATPLLVISAETGMYYTGLRQYIKMDYYRADLQDQESAQARNQSMVSTTIALALAAVAHMLLTALIAGRIWWVRRQLRRLVSPENRVVCSSLRKYDSVIALTVESGMLIPIFEVIYTVFYALNTGRTDHDALTVMPYLFPQVIAFAPLLIMVRVGLGLTVERDHVSELSSLNASITVPRNEEPLHEVQISIVADPVDETELDFRGRKGPPIDTRPES